MLREFLCVLLLGCSGLGAGVHSAAGQSADPHTYVPEALRLQEDDVPPDLRALPVPPATREGLRLRADAWTALQSLLGAAEREGIELRVISAYRSFEYQSRLYDRAVRTHGSRQRWVAAPGSSEHQLGTAVDVADAALAHVLLPSFAETPEGNWLRKNATRFGFVVSYTKENEARTGMQAEPWHIRFLGAKANRP